jgi:hypothetical protein
MYFTAVKNFLARHMGTRDPGNAGGSSDALLVLRAARTRETGPLLRAGFCRLPRTRAKRRADPVEADAEEWERPGSVGQKEGHALIAELLRK